MAVTLKDTKEDQERKLIQRAYRNLLRANKSKMDETDRKNIRMAYEMAVEAHKQQRRKSGEPYILHPIEVARICAVEIGLGPTAIVSALLHDVVEDTDVTLKDIKTKFGDKIGMIVDGLTKFDNLYDVASPQAENFRKILITLTKDVRVVLIKMADRIHNMRTLGSMPKHKQLKIASETAYIYAPLAHRLGLYAFKTEFEDLCMKITEPETYKQIANKLQKTKKERDRYINLFLKPLKEKLENSGIEYRISGRVKSVYSISRKIKRKKVPFEQVYDIFAVRIILDVPMEMEKSSCWNVYSMITDIYTPVPERLKDWISTPKANGYESLHTTVLGPKARFVEVQIRSVRMDEIAEKGYAAHWKYKTTNPNPSDNVFDIWLGKVREMLESPEGDAVDFLNDFRSNLFSEEVYVFTPKGEMRMFPKGSTALDFAFDIHSEVGYHCVGVKVDERQVPLSYQLKNGDRLLVVTNKNQKPNEGWLKMVVTGKAKSKIRSSLKEEKRKAGEIGKETLMRKFKGIKADFDPENVDVIVNSLGMPSHVDLYYEIANGHIDPKEMLKAFSVESGRLVKIETKIRERTAKPLPGETNRKKKPKPKLLINGENADLYVYSLATCCNPVQGDDIFAFTSSHDGTKIHRSNCPNATHLMANYGYRVMKAEWVTTYDSSFVADLRITGIDDIGVVQRITNILTNQLRVNMRSIALDGNDGYYEGRISVVVNNTDQLNFLINTLQKDESVTSVLRIE
ncbi:MAG: RelA/SpoT family protein [Bacteroidota bacterium]